MRIIQIGVGGFGRYWLPQVVEFPGVHVVGLVDLDQHALAEAGELSGLGEAAQFGELDEALSAVEADVLLCVTPPARHLAHTAAAMRAGLDVIVEKPLATTMQDARAIAAVARETGRLVSVSQQYRYRPPIWALRKQVQSGAIGELGQARIEFYKGWYFDKDNFRQAMPDPLLADMAIHHFDMLRFVTGLEATSVSGASWNPPWSENKGDTSVNVTFVLSNGARFVYTGSWAAQGDFAGWNGNWLLEGDRGSLRYAGEDVQLREATGRYETGDAQVVRQFGPPLEGQAYVLADMMAAREEGRQPATSVFDNLRSLGMVMAAREAVHSGTNVEIPDESTA